MKISGVSITSSQKKFVYLWVYHPYSSCVNFICFWLENISIVVSEASFINIIVCRKWWYIRWFRRDLQISFLFFSNIAKLQKGFHLVPEEPVRCFFLISLMYLKKRRFLHFFSLGLVFLQKITVAVLVVTPAGWLVVFWFSST